MAKSRNPIMPPLADKPVVTRGPAGPITKPEGAMNSAFDTKPAPCDVPKRPAPPDPLKLPIHKGRPLPPAEVGRRTDIWSTLFARMAAGDMVELAKNHAAAFVAWGKKQGKRLASRRISDDVRGVWRVE